MSRKFIFKVALQNLFVLHDLKYELTRKKLISLINEKFLLVLSTPGSVSDNSSGYNY